MMSFCALVPRCIQQNSFLLFSSLPLKRSVSASHPAAIPTQTDFPLIQHGCVSYSDWHRFRYSDWFYWRNSPDSQNSNCQTRQCWSNSFNQIQDWRKDLFKRPLCGAAVCLGSRVRLGIFKLHGHLETYTTHVELQVIHFLKKIIVVSPVRSN